MLNIFIIGLGGFCGAISRYLVTIGVTSLFDKPIYPIGTTVVNVFGCFLIGFLSTLDAFKHLFTAEVRFFIFIGFLGGFTTFSSFAFQAFSLIGENHTFLAIFDLFLQTSVGLAAVFAGFYLARMV